MPTSEVELTVAERRLLDALRALPPGPLATRLAALLDEMVALLGQPRCSEAQADGVPCGDTSTACAECERVEATLSALRQRLLEL